MGRGEERIGVFVCHCGTNIAGTVDVKRVVEELSRYSGVVHAEDYVFMCSEPGQELMRRAIRQHRLRGVVNANCSPSLHERTFRRAGAAEGLNPYLVEIANIREQCSWPHRDNPAMATEKAIAIVKAAVEKLRRNMALTPTATSVIRRALVVGAGPAGIQTALDIANGGHEVVLVEKDSAIGGRGRQLSRTFPALEKAAGLMAPRLAEVANHPRITLYTCAEVEEVSGYVGNFRATIRARAGYVSGESCNACGLCAGACPVKSPSRLDRGLSEEPAIHIPASSDVPFRPAIDPATCLRFQGGDCRACREVCPADAIDYREQDCVVEVDIGAVVVSTGFDLMSSDCSGLFPEDPDILDGLQFERLLSKGGPTAGAVRRPSDGRMPREIVFISCVGSRDAENGVPYCSRICCMYVAKQALLYRMAVPDGQAYVFYMDMRSDSRGFEEFAQGVMDEGGVLYLRGAVSRVYRDGDRIRVLGTDTLMGRNVEIEADMVVLARAVVPRPESRELGRRLNAATDSYGFLTEAHVKLRPVESLTSGVFLAGAAQWPRDLPDTASSASAAASKVLSLFSREELLHEPTVAAVDVETCTGCEQCLSVCAYGAISMDPSSKTARINEALCEGCGACAVTCPSKAMQHKNWTPRQLFEMIDVAA